jgi:hypothetical protein
LALIPVLIKIEELCIRHFSGSHDEFSMFAPGHMKWLGATRARLGLLHGWARPVCLKGSGCAQFAEGDF